MSIEPKDMVDYAYNMLSPQSNEMELRNIVNRAYYGAFLTARDHAGITRRGGRSVHKDVADHYRQVQPELSNKLDALKRQREIADYHPRDHVSLRDVEMSCARARKILASLDQN